MDWQDLCVRCGEDEAFNDAFECTVVLDEQAQSLMQQESVVVKELFSYKIQRRAHLLSDSQYKADTAPSGTSLTPKLGGANAEDIADPSRDVKAHGTLARDGHNQCIEVVTFGGRLVEKSLYVMRPEHCLRAGQGDEVSKHTRKQFNEEIPTALRGNIEIPMIDTLQKRAATKAADIGLTTSRPDEAESGKRKWQGSDYDNGDGQRQHHVTKAIEDETDFSPEELGEDEDEKEMEDFMSDGIPFGLSL